MEQVLALTAKQKKWLAENPVVAFYNIDPYVFLQLTSNLYSNRHFNEVEWFLWTTRPLEYYQTPKMQQTLMEYPFLRIDSVSGKVLKHEGRHRAAATKNAGYDHYSIAILLENGTEIPEKWFAQFDKQFHYLVDKSKLEKVDGAGSGD